MPDTPQYQLPLIAHEVQGEIVRQRSKDGYINATAMCKAAGREWKHFRELASTKRFIATLSARSGIPTSVLIQTVTGGDVTLQGTWVHPHVAISLGQWLSPDFAVQVSEWVFGWISEGSAKYEIIPDFVRRFHLNSDNISAGYFSVINELFIRMYGRLERLGYRIPDKAPDGKRLRPDVSVGKRFSEWLEGNHPDASGHHTMYWHVFDGGYRFQARQYPNWIWPHFIEFVDGVWIPDHSEDYFRDRDHKALEFLPKMLSAPAP